MRFAILGTGFVADYYLKTMANYPQHSLAGVYDINQARLKQFSQFYDCKEYTSQEALFADDSVETVVVLAWPDQHYALASAALDAGKHVYCEKPVALNLAHVQALVSQADKAGLIFTSAPANAHSDAFLLAQEQLKKNVIGTPRLIYAEMEDGAVFRDNWQEWSSESGAPWPGKHEFEVGCTLEHAGYSLIWLVELLGSIKKITGISATLFKDKGLEIAPGNMAPDFSTAVLEFESGAIARLTCGLCGPRDRSITIMGDDGTLTVSDVWDNRSNIYLHKSHEKTTVLSRIVKRLERMRRKVILAKPCDGRKLRYPSASKAMHLPQYPSQIDFFAGVDAIQQCLDGVGKSPRQLSARALHLAEATLALNELDQTGGVYSMTSSL